MARRFYTDVALSGELSWEVRGDTAANGLITSLATSGISTMYFSGSSPSLGGLTNPDSEREKLMFLFYEGDGVLTLLHENTSATANSRIVLPYNANIKVYPNEACILFYDSVNYRWKFLGKSTTYIPDIISTGEARINELKVTTTITPLISDPVINNLNIADFDGANDVLNGIAISNFVTNNSYSAFVVGLARTIGTNDVNGYLNEAFYGDAGGYIAMYLRSSNLIGAYNWDGENKVATNAYTPNTVVIGYSELSSGSIRIRTNGGSETATVSSNTQNLSFAIQIGRNFNSNTFCLDGKIAEIIFTNSALSTTNRQLIEGYLAWKWGLQANLPIDHPYKNNPPTL